MLNASIEQTLGYLVFGGCVGLPWDGGETVLPGTLQISPLFIFWKLVHLLINRHKIFVY